jgi:hypothetical protein
MCDKLEGGGERTAILGLSDESRRRLIFAARNAPESISHLLTLTYPKEFPTDGKVVKEHWRQFRLSLRNRSVGGLWWLEFQRRGAPHFHVAVNAALDKEWVSRRWFDVVGSGDPKHLNAGTRCELLREKHALASYVGKLVGEAIKRDQKVVPAEYRNVGRFWGWFGGLGPVLVSAGAGSVKEMAPVVRVAVRAHTASRKEYGMSHIRDGGEQGFTLYDVSSPVTRFLEQYEAAKEQEGQREWIRRLCCTLRAMISRRNQASD